jgi:glutaredoxin
MGKKKIIIVLGVAGVLIVGLIVWAVMEGKREQQLASIPDASTIYFFGEECPHCKRINEFLEANDVAAKFTFTKKEVWHSRTNSAQMKEKAEACGLDPSKVGVPFIYTEGNKCLIGEPDVKKFFAEKAGITVEEGDQPEPAPAQ